MLFFAVNAVKVKLVSKERLPFGAQGAHTCDVKCSQTGLCLVQKEKLLVFGTECSLSARLSCQSAQ